MLSRRNGRKNDYLCRLNDLTKNSTDNNNRKWTEDRHMFVVVIITDIIQRTLSRVEELQLTNDTRWLETRRRRSAENAIKAISFFVRQKWLASETNRARWRRNYRNPFAHLCMLVGFEERSELVAESALLRLDLFSLLPRWTRQMFVDQFPSLD